MKSLINFDSEKECILFFKSFREELGVVCKSCMSTEHYWLNSKDQWQCKKCRFRTTLKSGTAFQYSNLKLSTCLKALEYYSDEDLGLSARSLQRRLEFKRYEPVWVLLHKLRKYMGQWTRNLHCPNSGYVYEGKVFVKCSAEEKRQRGCIARTQTILMSYGVQTLENERLLKSFKSGLRMYIVNRLQVPKVSKYLLDVWNERISFKYPQGIKSANKQARITKELQRIKETIFKTHTWVSETYVSNYLNDYCFRRNFKSSAESMFERLLQTTVYPWWSII